MPASTITMADFGLLWGPCLRERLPLDILSHWFKNNHGCPEDKPFENVRLPDGKNRLSRAVGTSNFRGLTGYVEKIVSRYDAQTEKFR